jgi:type IV pilus assembly protein PilE
MKASGFTLLELIIALSIISILIAIAAPQYTSHIVKIRRENAKVALLDLAANLEQYYNQNNSYTGATINNLRITNVQFYDLAIAKADENNYLVTATPQKADPECGILSLDNLGNKTISGTGNINECWIS